MRNDTPLPEERGEMTEIAITDDRVICPSDAAPRAERRWRDGRTVVGVALELVVVATVFQLYRAGRGITREAGGQAMDNAHRVIGWERALGVFTERDIQHWVLQSQPVVSFLNRYYVSVHFPLTIAFLVWAFVRHGRAYRRIRTWFVVVTLAALGIHVLFPLAPPRMTGGFVDTLRVFGPHIYPADTSQSVANQFAAMPSLHFGWALMVAVGVVAIVRRPAAGVAFVHPVITLIAIVATGNHYWFDAVVAGALAAVSGVVLLVVWRRRSIVDPRADVTAVDVTAVDVTAVDVTAVDVAPVDVARCVREPAPPLRLVVGGPAGRGHAGRGLRRNDHRDCWTNRTAG